MKNATMMKKGLMLFSILLGSTASLFAASVELWPSDQRRNETQFCYGNDWNMLRFGLYSDKGQSVTNSNGKYKFELPKSFTEATVLEVTLPKAVEFLGVYRRGDDRVSKEFETTTFTEDGKEFTRIRIPLDNKMLNELMWDSFYEVQVWYKPPERLDDKLTWTLTYGGKNIASSTVRLRTAGVVREGRTLPKRFGFYPFDGYRVVPDGDFDKMADFYKRFGITGVGGDWSYGLPQSDERFHNMLEANHRHGIKNVALIDPFCVKHGKDLDIACPQAVTITDGLVGAMDNACAGIESEAAKKDWEAAGRYFDMALHDWEPAGPNTWPGYDDAATAAAFAKAKGIAGPLTPELLRTTYRKAYARFRMEQTARPVYSLKKTIDAVKPIPLFIVQGAGLNRNIDYDIYGNDFEFLGPMIYTPSPIAYARDLLEMLKSASVPAKKFMPHLTIGWPAVGPFRESPEEFLLDTIISAAAGLSGVAHWPELYRTDAALFGVHEGLARIAMVEEFYFDGKPVDKVSITGIPYREKKIDIGNKTVAFYGPDWRPVLFSFVHEWKNEYLLTILNYHTDEDAFVKISSPVLRNLYLANPVDKTYCICDDAGQAVVRVGKESPMLWIATADKNRIAGFKRIEPDAIKTQFKAAKENYLKTNTEGNVKLGKAGDIDVAYDQIEFGGSPRICLRVSTPTQSLFFGNSGGRVYDWTVKNMPAFVSGKNYGTDGFGMDLLWLPEGARWSGDEIADMKLAECENDGKEARLVYEGKFKSGFSGVKIRKEYIVPASGSSMTAVITLRNEQAGPVTLSYWQHNVLKSTTAHFIAGTGDPIHRESGTSVFSAKDLPEKLRQHIVEPDNIVGTTGGAYAEYFPEIGAGLVFRLPDNFMNVYRWSSHVTDARSSEWMSRPLTIPAGGSETLRYSITAVPKATPEALHRQMQKN